MKGVFPAVARVNELRGKFFRFAIAGALSTAVQYAVLIAGVAWLHAAATVSSGAGFLLSVGINYLLNHRITFQSARPHRSAAWRFALVASAGLLINVLLMALLTNHQLVDYRIAQLVASAVVLLWNFFGSLFWSFTDPPIELRPIGNAPP